MVHELVIGERIIQQKGTVKRVVQERAVGTQYISGHRDLVARVMRAEKPTVAQKAMPTTSSREREAREGKAAHPPTPVSVLLSAQRHRME